MLTINPIGQNNVQKKNVNFTSKLVATDYLEEGIQYAGKRLKFNQLDETALKFVKAIKGILNDGREDIIKIDRQPGSFQQPGRAALQDIFVNGEKVVSGDCHSGCVYDGPQCMEGIVDFAQKRNLMAEASDLEKNMRDKKNQAEKAEQALKIELGNELLDFEKTLT